MEVVVDYFKAMSRNLCKNSMMPKKYLARDKGF